MSSFRILSTESRARAGKIITPHGIIDTPSYVAVGTLGAVRGLCPADLELTGTRVIIANTYHLHLRPGEGLIERMGGLHPFMRWKGPLMTDSGGFQIFSLGAGREQGVGKIASVFPEQTGLKQRSIEGKGPLVKVGEDGVEFRSYLDGSVHFFTPEHVIEIETRLGADIILVLDECTSPLHSYGHTLSALNRTHRWALRSLEKFDELSAPSQSLFGIVQGGPYRDLREKSSTFISSLGFDGYAIGGSLGKSKEDMHRILDWTLPNLDPEKPRHLLGIGEIEDIFEVVERGIDMFDCITPSLMARTGTLFNRRSKRFRINILNSAFREDLSPIEEGCACYTCMNYTKAYLRHLFMAKELLAPRLAAIHNHYFVEALMKDIRSAIRQGGFSRLKRDWLG